MNSHPRMEVAGLGSDQLETAAGEHTSGALAGGKLLAAISTSIVAIIREHYGRGPMKAKTYALDDIIVVVMRGSGFTPLEQTIMNSGELGEATP
jgi:Na+-translocating membrane potential-generating system (MpsC)